MALLAGPVRPEESAKNPAEARPMEPTAAGKPLSYWERALGDKKSRDHKNAPLALATIGAPAVPVLSRTLAGRDPSLRIAASLALSRMGREARGAVPALFKALDDDNRHVRMLSAQTLVSVGERPGELVAVLVQWLDSTDPVLRVAAFGTLGRLGPAGKPAVPALRRHLQGKDSDARKLAAEALKEIETP
jgi:HEAT repeat protein